MSFHRKRPTEHIKNNKSLSLQIQSLKKSQSCENSISDEKTPGGTSGDEASSCADHSAGGRAALRGSITAEAAMALSIFLLFFAAIFGAFSVLQQEEETLYELDVTCEKAAMAAALLEKGDASYDGDINLALINRTKITFWGKSREIPVGVSVSRRAWTGRVLQNREEEKDSDSDRIYVFVCTNGTVYHVSENCTYLKISVKAVSYDSVAGLRNAYGSRYQPCERCGEICGSTVYITEKGTRYHSDSECGGLKRTYTAYPKDTIRLPACSRCGGS